MGKLYYKNKLTGNYGVIEELRGQNQSFYLRLKLLRNVDNEMIGWSDQYENVTAENLVQVSLEEVKKELLGF